MLVLSMEDSRRKTILTKRMAPDRNRHREASWRARAIQEPTTKTDEPRSRMPMSLRRSLFSGALLISVATISSGLEAQAQTGDLARVVAKISGWSPSEPFGAVSDVVTSDRFQRVYVLDAMNGEISVFSAMGEPLFRVGRTGQGPGEISKVARNLFVFDDGTFGVADLGNQRITIWDQDGAVVDDWGIPLTEGTPVDWRASGRRLVAEFSPPRLALLRGAGGHNKLISFNSDGTDRRLLFEFRDVDPLLSFGPDRKLVTRPMAELPIWATDHKGRVLVGRTGSYELQEVSGRTALSRTESVQPRPVTEAMKGRIRKRFENAAAGQGQPVPEIDYPEFLPLVGGVLILPSGEVLIRHREYTEAGSDLPGSEGLLWDVFDESGTLIQSFRLPGGFVLKGAVGRSFVGRVQDEFDIPSVVILQLKSWVDR